MDLTKNYYSDLNLSNAASIEDIKKSYRKLALKYHPDKNQDDPNTKDKFQIVYEAYKILSDKNVKERYDRQSIYGKNYQPYNFKYKGFNNKTGYEEQLNVNVNVSLTINEIYSNSSKIIKYKRYKQCEHCNATGFEPNDNWSECLFCDGKKIVNGKPCKYCKGTGRLYRNKCTKCDGNKVVLKTETLTINNIFMLNSHRTVRYKHFGHFSRYFENKIGELVVVINVKDNKRYKRIDDDLHIEQEIHFADLITGTELKITLPDKNEHLLKIKANTKANKVFKVKNKGFMKKNKTRGDLYIKLITVIDYNRITDKLKTLLEDESRGNTSNNNSSET